MEIWKDLKAIERCRHATPEEKLDTCFSLIDFTSDLAEAGVRNQHPDWDDERVFLELRRRAAE